MPGSDIPYHAPRECPDLIQLPLPGEAIFRNLTFLFLHSCPCRGKPFSEISLFCSYTVAPAGGSHFQKSNFFVPTQLPLPGEAIFRNLTVLFLHSCPCRGKPFSKIYFVCSYTAAPAGGSHFQKSNFFVPSRADEPSLPQGDMGGIWGGYGGDMGGYGGIWEKAPDITDYHTILLGNARI
jgi:hypothetical protein